MRRRGQMGNKILERRHVRRDAFQDEIDLARQHPAFPHQRFRAHELLEGPQIGVGLAGQMYRGEHRDVESKPVRVEKPR